MASCTDLPACQSSKDVRNPGRGMANIFHQMELGINVKLTIELDNNLIIDVLLTKVSKGLNQKAAGFTGSCHIAWRCPLQDNLPVADLHCAG